MHYSSVPVTVVYHLVVINTYRGSAALVRGLKLGLKRYEQSYHIVLWLTITGRSSVWTKKGPRKQIKMVY